MKKILIVCSVIMLAAMTQAAAFNWAGITKTTNGNADFPGWMGENASFYLVYLGTTVGGFGDGDFDRTSRPMMGNAFGGGTVVATFNQTSGYDYNGGTAGYTYSAAEAVINGNYAMFYIDEGTTDTYGVQEFTVSGITNAGSTQSVGPTDLDAGMFQTVPEPTSMALLALGIAALGLRRRR